MSHFTCLVVGDDVEAILQPFHEFECTGTNDQFVKDIDQTEELRAKFEAETKERLKAPDGTLHSFFDEDGNWRPEFSQPDTKREFALPSDRMRFVPPGYELVEVPVKEVMSFAAFIDDWSGQKSVAFGAQPDLAGEHKYGYALLDASGEVVKVIDRTNPNRKWDWWTVGGRWKNKLVLKDGRKADQARCGDVDWDGMIQNFAHKAGSEYDQVMGIIASRPVITWEQAFARHMAGEITIQEARTLYHDQVVVKELVAAKAIDSWDGAETLTAVLKAADRDQYAKQCGELNATTWAFLHEGVWNERGRMGWFGMSDATEGTTIDYVAGFWHAVRNLPADIQVTVVDCHI